ncbi:MAG: 1,4-dihydroxy-2-naphthoate octaprenyltransferase, partial [Terrimicrobiaceae bacterium]|nr:1,4-dihydroxy-2-naphthoate octaprenyltransferase [Terrimicrobiaceae bacterium]
MSSPWVAAARPKTLFASACPVILGAVAAAREAPIPWPWLLATLACALLLQITANYANDYWDFRKGADTPRRKGPPRMTASGRVAPRAMLAATCISLLLALLMGAVLTWRGGWPILLIGLAAAASAILYTSGPFPLAYRGLGEVFALVFFGPVAAAGTAWVLALAWMPEAALLGLAPGGFSTALMSLNNLRDREEDARAGKRTLAVRFGERVGRGVIVLSLWL